MRRFVIFFISIASVFVSCNKEEADGTGRIAFRVAVGASSTKAATSEYSGGAFGSYAWKTSGTWESTADASKLSTPYMVNAQTTKTDTKWYPGSFRWPSATAYLHFACYAPYKSVSPMTYNLADGICFDNYAINYSGTVDDLLYSDLSKNNTDTKTACPVVFHHALCQIKVSLLTDGIPDGLETDVVTSTTVTLKSLTFSGLRTNGGFKQNSSPKWSGQSGSSTYVVFSGSQVLTTVADEKNAFYVMPQTFEEGVQAINLIYDVSMTYNGGSTKTRENISETHYFSDFTSPATWEPGRQVAYTITVSAFGDKVSFGDASYQWDENVISGNLGGGD